MSAPRAEMHRLQELVRLYRMGVGVRERARLLGMSTRTERRYVGVLKAGGLLEGSPDEVPELGVLREAVEALLPPSEARSGPESSAEKWDGEIAEAVRTGVGPTALYDRLRREVGGFSASLSAIKRAYRRIQGRSEPRAEDVAIPVETEPGDVVQVDFGQVGSLFDEESGRVRPAWVFVMVLGYSRHLFARVVFDQRTTTWLELHVQAFKHFGGVPRTVVPDNLRAAIVRAAFGASDRHEVAINRSYRELARHYGFKIDPTPTYAPKKKGKVESAVSYIKHNLFAAAELETLTQANQALEDWVVRIAGARIHGSTRRRPLEAFEEERGRLLPLPPTRYRPVEWKLATVHRDSHIEFDRRLYSVPWTAIGRQVWVRATPDSVYVLLNDQRIATHERQGESRRSTDENHLPEGRRDLRHRCPPYWLARADRLSPAIGAFVREVMDSDDVLSKLRDVQAVVQYLEGFPLHRAEAACKRASFYGNLSYAAVKRILVQGLDLEPLPVPSPQHGLLASPRFARTAAELLAAYQESPDECH